MHATFGRRILLLAAGIFWLAIPAYPGDLTVYVGRVNPGKLTIENVRTGLDGSEVYGIRYGSTFAGFLGFEQTMAYSPDFLRREGSPAAQEVNGLIFNSNFMLSAPTGHVVPYATVGLGSIIQYGSGPLPRFGTKFAVNYGGGLKIPRLAGPVGLRIDARGYTAPGIFSNSLNIFEVSGGVLFTFGR